MGTDNSKKRTFSLEDTVARFGNIRFEQPMSRDQFLEFVGRFPDLRMDRDAKGKVTIMSPVKKGTSRRESILHGLLFVWWQQTKLGEVLGPSTGFDLPNTAFRSPDVAWVSNERLVADPAGEEEFTRAVPDFIAEIRSGSVRLGKLQKKMADTWILNGVRLAWLIDPYAEKVYVYRPGQEVAVISGFTGQVLSGGDVLPGFELPLDEMKRQG